MKTDPVSVEPDDSERAVELRTGPAVAESQRSGAGEADAAPESRRGRVGRLILPLIVLLLGFSIYSILVATREKPVRQDFVAVPPLVRIQSVTLQPLRLTVSTRGTVLPRTESDLVSEVSGRIVWLSPKLVVGGFFEAGDELLRLDERQHRIARDRARATVALRRSEARLAVAEAKRGGQLRERGAASAADLEQFQSRELVAEASLDEARASLEQAELDLERTVLRAPFEGRVRERNVDVGRFVTSGTKLGRIFAVDYSEVRLPIQMDDLAYLEGAFGSSPGQEGMLASPGRGDESGAEVKLTGRLGGRDHHWSAYLERAEAAIDEQTRMLHVVARIANPYGLAKNAMNAETREETAVVIGASERRPAAALIEGSVPLPSGLFVHAEIKGREVTDVAVLPPLSLRDGDRVFVFEPDPESTPPSIEASVVAAREGWLRVREVSVLRRDQDRVVIDGGLERGDRVVVSPLRIYSDGMRLRVVEAGDS